MEADNESPIIQLVGLGRQFRTIDDPVTALEDINLEIQYGGVFGITDLSGVGKSTLIRYVDYLEMPTSGGVTFEGKNLSVMKDRERRLVRQSMGTILQRLNLLSQRNILQNAYFPLGIARVSKTGAKKRAEELLTLVSLEDRMKACPAQFSGGQKQRVTIARAMAADPKVLLCNKATGTLDFNTIRSILELLEKINREMGITVIVITHEMTVIEAIYDRVAVIDHSRIAEVGNISDTFPGPKSDINRQLILGDVAEQSLSSGNSCQIRTIFDRGESSEPVIANMMLVCKVPVNIVYADTGDIGDKATGQVLVQFPKGDADANRICNHLKIANVKFEEVR